MLPFQQVYSFNFKKNFCLQVFVCLHVCTYICVVCVCVCICVHLGRLESRNTTAAIYYHQKWDQHQSCHGVWGPCEFRFPFVTTIFINIFYLGSFEAIAKQIWYKQKQKNCCILLLEIYTCIEDTSKMSKYMINNILN